jgi:signal transduction histidine kinase
VRVGIRGRGLAKVGIRGRLIALVLGAAIPLMVVGLAGLDWIWTEGRKQLDASLEKQAELAAAAFHGWVEAQQQSLLTIAASVAQEPKKQPLSRDDLRFFVKTRPSWIDLQIFNSDGEQVFAHPTGATPLPDAVIESLRDPLRQGPLGAVEMDWRLSAGRPVLAIGSPVEGGGVVIVRVDATTTSEIFRDIELPDRAVIAVFDPRRRIVFRSANPSLTGDDRRDSPLFAMLGDQRTAVVELHSPDDEMRRVYGVARVGSTGCVVTVGVPSDVFYEPARAQLRRYAIFSVLALVLAVLASVLIARGIAYPIVRLSDAASRLGGGDLAARADVVGTGEVADLALEFNDMAASLQEREARLSELDRLKSEFVGSVSHELRTPLTTIKTLTSVLLRGGHSITAQREYLETIAAECDRQIDLVLNLLDLSRIEAGAFSLAPKPVAVLEVVRVSVSIEQHAAVVRGHLIVVDLPDDLPPASADRVALRRVLCCLFENAFKYTPDGGRILVSARYLPEDLIAISVTDNGQGIRREDLPHVFDKFYRGQIPNPLGDEPGFDAEYAETSGVGLGLYVARSIVKHLGGDIEVASDVGIGTTFTVKLPVWHDGDSDAELEDRHAVVETLARRR